MEENGELRSQEWLMDSLILPLYGTINLDKFVFFLTTIFLTLKV
jgi:hypothetical protein